MTVTPDRMFQFVSAHVDPEMMAIDICAQAMNVADLDAKACRRLIVYLDSRYGNPVGT